MSQPSIKQLEKLTAIVGSIAILVLLIVRAQSAGGLWRDECAALQLARMPDFGEIARNFQHEAFPLFFPAVIRVVTDVFGTSDGVLRCFGLIVGIGLIGAAWFSVRAVTGEVPLLFIALVGLNPTVLTWATSVRGYGLGSVLIVLVFGLVAGLLVKTTWPRIVVAMLVSLAGVHCLLHNSALLLAINGSAGGICLFRRDFKRAGIILGIGLICAFSLVPYLRPLQAAGTWNVVVQSPVSPEKVWKQLLVVLGSPVPAMSWVWVIVGASLLAAAVWRLYSTRLVRPKPEWDKLLFFVCVLSGSLIASYVFFQFLNYTLQAWYYVALVSVLGLALDFMAASVIELRWPRMIRLGFVLIALVILPFAAWPKMTLRQTNIDLAAGMLERSAAETDLIVVSPWQFGIPFARYYHGETRWITLPTISDHRIHRYDLLKAKMVSLQPIDDVLELVSGALKAGHQVWIVGAIRFSPVGAVPLSLPPAPNSQFGWDNVAYISSWEQQLGAFVRAHAWQGTPVTVSTNNPVNPLEAVPVFVVRGWKD